MHQWRWLFGVLALALVTLTACDGREPGARAPQNSGSPEASAAPEQTEPESDDSREAQMASNGDEEATLWVLQARGNRQCEGGGITLEQSRTKLEASGIAVAESRCAVRTDRMYPSVCGGATGDMLAHSIPASMLDAALELEFDPATQVPHRFIECPAEPAPGAKPTR